MPKYILMPATLAAIILAWFSLSVLPSKADVSDHIVISEIQIYGENSSGDFIELYNPTSSEISLSGYRLVKRSSTGSTDDGIVVFGSSETIPAHGFYLWCNSSISEELACDRSSGSTIAFNNSVALRYGASDTGDIIDAVTIGTVLSPLGEGLEISEQLAAYTSIERKAQASSTSDSMSLDGPDELKGNGEDTDDNSADFVIREFPQPQNSSSEPESPSFTPSPTATNSPTAEPTIDPTASPTIEPTSTPTPSPTSSPTPSPTILPSPTATPQTSKAPPGWIKSPVFICTNNHVPEFVYNLLKTLMPHKFNCE
jgi:hypothetical protein